jgi:hypothetical protein
MVEVILLDPHDKIRKLKFLYPKKLGSMEPTQPLELENSFNYICISASGHKLEKINDKEKKKYIFI